MHGERAAVCVQARSSSAVYAAAISACVPTAQPRRATALLSSMQAASPPLFNPHPNLNPDPDPDH